MRPDDDPDHRLMLQAQGGDAGAFAAIVERHGAAVVNFAQRILGSSDDAEDLAQDVFFRAFRALPTWQARARLRTWLFTITTNLCLNHRRSEGLRRHRSLDPSSDGHSRSMKLEPSGGPPPGGAMEREELRRAVRDAVDDLPPQQRVAMVLARYEELPYAEIAEVMGVTVMAVKSLLNRARESLRRRLARELKEYEALTPDDHDPEPEFES